MVYFIFVARPRPERHGHPLDKYLFIGKCCLCLCVLLLTYVYVVCIMFDKRINIEKEITWTRSRRRTTRMHITYMSYHIYRIHI